jgi:SAM-dependent methyltransferase
MPNLSIDLAALHAPYAGLLRAALAAASPPLRGPALDLAGGAGLKRAWLAATLSPPALAIGSDLDRAAAAAAPWPSLCADALALPLASASLGRCWCVAALALFADQPAALAEARRVLRPGGRLLIRLPAYEFLRSKHDRAVHTRRRYTASTVRALIGAAGFYVERCTYVLNTLFPLALAQRMIEKAMPTLERDDSDLSLPSPSVNAAMRMPLAIEAAYVGLGGSLPFGLSIVCLAHSGKLDRIMPQRKKR